jgi:polysaccharide pyruvyl transferase WcaK-like protein
MTTLRGGAVYNFLPPGGRTWTKAPSPARGARGALGAVKKRCTDVVAGPRVAIGASVIPTADHSWCRDCEWVGVRDHESLAALRAAGLPRVDYFPDLAFLPAPRPTNSPRRGGIRMSFRGAIPETSDAAGYGDGLSGAIAVVMQELESDGRVNVRGFHQVEEDASPSRALSRAHGFAFDERRVGLDSFESFYASADLVISNRLHCLLLGAYCGAVPVALTSRQHGKVNALFETVGWKSLVLHIEDRDAIARRLRAIRN